MTEHSRYEELVASAKRNIIEMSPTEAAQKARRGEAVIVDVREKDEWDEGHIPGALHLSRGAIELEEREVVGERLGGGHDARRAERIGQERGQGRGVGCAGARERVLDPSRRRFGSPTRSRLAQPRFCRRLDRSAGEVCPALAVAEPS